MTNVRSISTFISVLCTLVLLVTALAQTQVVGARSFASIEPELALSPETAVPGLAVTVSGQGFAPDVAGVLSWEPDGSQIGEFVSDTLGEFSTQVTVPEVPGGTYELAARVMDGSGEWPVVAVASITVESPPTEVIVPPTETTVPIESVTATTVPTETPPELQTATIVSTSTAVSASATPKIATESPSKTASATATATGTPSAAVVAALSGDSVTLPIRATFYYPWFPNAWTQGSVFPYTNYTPSAGFYDGADAGVIGQQIAAMQYGNIQAGISSWWGKGHHTDARLPKLLSAAAGTGFKWTIYYEMESTGNPSVQQIRADLTYLRDSYANDPSYLRVNGKFVVFVYADGSDSCGMADRWNSANTVGAYVVLKVFSGFKSCASQPQSWHQYSPSKAADAQSTFSYSISPGFWKIGEQPRLERDVNRWAQNVRDMVNSGAQWQLVVSFNEWGEGTAIESATAWKSKSTYGTYLDLLHTNGVNTVTPTATRPSSSTTPVSSADATKYKLVASAASVNSAASTYVRDGKMSTIWKTKLFRAGPPTQAWVLVDLGSSKPIGSIRWVFGEAGIGDYFVIEGSNNKVNWSYITARNGKPVGKWQEKVQTRSFRYIRFRFENPNRDRYLGGIAEVQLWSLGTMPPLPTPTATATPTQTPSASNVLIAAGDIADCSSQGDESTAKLLDTMPGVIAALGDLAYEDGSASDFADCYDPSWGRHNRTRPAPGNHEYHTSGATGTTITSVQPQATHRRAITATTLEPGILSS